MPVQLRPSPDASVYSLGGETSALVMSQATHHVVTLTLEEGGRQLGESWRIYAPPSATIVVRDTAGNLLTSCSLSEDGIATVGSPAPRPQD